MGTLLFLFVFVLYSAYAQNNSNCAFPENSFTECAQVISSNNSDHLKKLYPWHIALYRQKPNAEKPINVCSGTLISPSVFLTAAHCLSEDVDGSLRDITQYSVAAGNDYREIDDPRDAAHRQIRLIKSVILTPAYKGHQSGFEGDIAIVTLQQPFAYSEVVRPACLAGISTTNTQSKGHTVGWGLTTASRHPDTRLSHLRVPYIDISSCKQQVNQEFHKFLVHADMFCGEFANGASICSTDNGAGILFEADGRWFLDGVAGVGLIGGGSCDTRQLNAFSSLRTYLPLICNAVQQTN